MISMVSGSEYAILLVGLAASILIGIGAAVVAFFKKQ